MWGKIICQNNWVQIYVRITKITFNKTMGHYSYNEYSKDIASYIWFTLLF